MISVSTSLQALLNQPAFEPRWFVDIETGSGMRYISNERLTWGGNSYEARLATIPQVQTDLGPPGLVGPHDVSIDIANADGAWSQYRPEFFRGRHLTVKQGFREVDSEAVWAIKFKMTSTEVVNPELFRIGAGDLLGDLRRKLIPNDTLLITTSAYPQMPSDSPAAGRVVPVAFGYSLTPMYLVEDQTSGRPGAAARFVARPRDPTDLTAFPNVFQSFNEELVAVASYTSTVETFTNGLALGMVQQASNPRIGGVGQLVPHFVYASTGLGHRDPVTGDDFPDLVLLHILTHSYLGGGDGPMLVDSANWYSAQHDVQNPLITPVWDGWNHWAWRFGGALTEQAPLEDVLDDWAYSSYAHLLIRDKVRIVQQVWRDVVYSFHPGNILAGTLTRRDVPLEELQTTHVLHYQRTRNPEAPPDTEPRSVVKTEAGSGATFEHVSHFIGSQRMAQQVTDVWARREAAAVRTYELDTTVRAALLEEGDLVSLYHPLYCNVTSFGLAATGSEYVPGQLCEVVGLTRGETVRVRLREADLNVFLPINSSAAPAGTSTLTRAALITYGGANVSINPTPITITTSHRLSGGTSPGSSAPSLVYARLLPNAIATTINSLVSANNSQFTLALASTASYDSRPSLQGFFARL